jgi:RNA polymerase sigma-70 factor, ECF subfamily
MAPTLSAINAAGSPDATTISTPLTRTRGRFHAQALQKIAQAVGARYLIQFYIGSLRSWEHDRHDLLSWRLTAQLWDASDGEIVWERSTDESETKRSLILARAVDMADVERSAAEELIRQLPQQGSHRSRAPEESVAGPGALRRDRGTLARWIVLYPWRRMTGTLRMGSDYAGRARPAVAWLALAPYVARRSAPAVNSLRRYAAAPDAELISWSAHGDRRAFDEIVTRHGPFALRVALRLVPDASLAEELVQEAMVRAWSQARHFDPRRARFTTWLYRILVNRSIDYRRRPLPEPLPEDFDPVDPAAGADERMALDERHAALARALRDLPARQRAAMTLVYDEGLSSAEAARVLGLSAKAVERLLARARAFLRERLRPDDERRETRKC